MVRGIIVALDLPTAESAVDMAEEVADHVVGFKIGLGLLHGPGPLLIPALVALGKPVFADAKLNDIPSQVEVAARRLGEHGARWVTAHVNGGQAMLEAAVAGLRAGRRCSPGRHPGCHGAHVARRRLAGPDRYRSVPGETRGSDGEGCGGCRL